MTTPPTDTLEKAKGGGIMKSVLSSMWAYWFLLLAVSLGCAAAIYLIWLKGTM
jgi:ABC-type phosphate transport system permease subunit